MRAVKFHSTSLIQNGDFEYIRVSAAKWPILIEGNRRHQEQATKYVVSGSRAPDFEVCLNPTLS